MSARVFRSLAEARGNFAPCSLAIGNFDGVHIGHRALLDVARRFAAERNLTPSVLTFHPHPTAVVAPDRKPLLICTLQERLKLLDAAGAEQIFVLPFTEDISRLTPAQFVSTILVETLKTKEVFVGENFRFGHKQSGTPGVLAQLGEKFGFESHFIAPVCYRGEVVSSSAVRRYLKDGNVSRAGRLLGRCFSTEGEVVAGRGVGSKQLVPTLNVRPNPEQALPLGIYATETFDTLRNRSWQSITNVGTSPTFGTTETVIETYLLSPFDGLTPESIQVDFRHFIRRETWFPTIEALRVQIMKDVARAQAYWRRLEKPISSIY